MWDNDFFEWEEQVVIILFAWAIFVYYFYLYSGFNEIFIFFKDFI